jgi:FkbM family methyltransferase
VSGHVIAVEALPYYAKALRLLFALLLRRNIRLVNAAVTREKCSVRMIWKDPRGQRLTGLTHVAAPGEESGQAVEVEGIPLDELLGEDRARVCFIKVDVEGGEIGVFAGGLLTLREGRPVVLSEVSHTNLGRYGQTPEDLYRLFGSVEYEKYALMPGRGLVAFDDLAATGCGDVFFVPREKIQQWVG